MLIHSYLCIHKFCSHDAFGLTSLDLEQKGLEGLIPPLLAIFVQGAKQGALLCSSPSVLLLQLQRFSFDKDTGTTIKVRCKGL